MAERAPDERPRRRRDDDTPPVDETGAAGPPSATTEPPRRSWWALRRGKQGLLALLTVTLGVLALGLAGLWIVSNTDWGRERVRRYAIDEFESNSNGRLRIGWLSGNLLEGFTMHAVAITERNGAPFIAADSMRAQYGLRAMLNKQIQLQDVVLWRPVVVLDNPPNGKWNFQRIFPGKGPDVPKDSTPGFGNWVWATNLRVVDGDVVVKSTWKPSDEAPRAERVRDIREAVGGKGRTVIVPHPAGFQKVIRFSAITATLPRLTIADPRMTWRVIDVSRARLIAHPFRSPHADVRDLQGTFRLDGDSVWWKGARLLTPGSRIIGDGRYWFRGDDAWIRGRGEQIALADFRWAYPRLPSQGGGPANIEYRYTDEYMTFRARDMDVRIGAQRARGSLGITFADAGPEDTLIVHDTRMRIERVDTRLLEQVIGFESPRRGTLSGQITLAGGVLAMRADGDVEFREVRSGYNRFIGGGIIGFTGTGDDPATTDVVARNLRLRLAPMQVALIGQDFPDVPLGGTMTGNVVVNGSVEKGGTVVGDVVHLDRGARSAFTGRATAFYEREPIRFDVDGRFHPLSLAVAARFAPKLGLRGSARGPVKVRGTENDFSLDTELAIANGGAIETRGRVRLAGEVPGYDLAMRARSLDLGVLSSRFPSTMLTGTAQATGRGVTPETLDGRYVVNLHESRWDTLAVDSVVGAVQVANGVLEIDRFRIGARGIEAVAEGSFGMRAGRDGTLSYRVAVEDLGNLRSIVPRLGADTGIVRPRPGILAERMRRARQDSVRVARATEIERIVTGGAVPRVVVDTPRAIPRGALGGRLFAAGTARGWVRDFDLRGRAGGENIVAMGSAARLLTAEYAWTNARTPTSALALGVRADSVSTYGFAFDTVDARLAYGADKRGRVELVARQGTDRDYAVRGNFVFHPEHRELHLANASFRFDTTTWALAQPAAIQWGGRGIAVQNVDLRNGPLGRIWVNGLLPTEGVANLDLALDDVQLSHLADIAQSDLDVAGHITLRGHLEGTLRSPVFRGSFGVPDATYSGTPVPELRGTFAYAGQQLQTHLLAVRGDTARPIAVLDATLPINLAFSGVQGKRFSGDGLRVDIAADSMPLDLVPQFTDVVRDVHGFAAGRVVLRGSLDRPALTGAVVIRDAKATVSATGTKITGIHGAVRMLNDTVRVDSLVGRSKGHLRLTGGLAVGNWREPTFDLHLVADEARVLDNDRGEVHADMALALTGPFRSSYLAGKVTILGGVIYIPELRDVQNISPGDPSLFAVLDTSIIAERELLPAENPLFDNLRVDIDVQVNRNTWVRTRDANIEIFSDGLVHVSRERVGADRAALALTGIVSSDRGEYRLFSKRFQVKRGSAVFIGSPELNPTLQLTAEYEARPPGREAVNVRIVLGGTLNKPRLSLETDAQPPISQTDLLSFLAFGKESGSLLEFEGSPLSSKSGSTNLAGVGKVAGRRLASVALGLAVDEVEGDASRDLGVDVINITPEDVPTGFGTSGMQDFLLGTRLEAGKYVNPRTFVAVYGSPSVLAGRGQTKAPPGIRLEHRANKGWRFQTSLEPRLRLRDPSLTVDPKPVSPISVFGLFLIREWRF